MNNDETRYSIEELARAIGCSIEELLEILNSLIETTKATYETLEEAFKKEKYDENLIRERSYERPNKRSHRVLNAESKRKSRVAFHAAPGTCQYIRGRDGGGRYR